MTKYCEGDNRLGPHEFCNRFAVAIILGNESYTDKARGKVIIKYVCAKDVPSYKNAGCTIVALRENES